MAGQYYYIPKEEGGIGRIHGAGVYSKHYLPGSSTDNDALKKFKFEWNKDFGIKGHAKLTKAKFESKKRFEKHWKNAAKANRKHKIRNRIKLMSEPMRERKQTAKAKEKNKGLIDGIKPEKKFTTKSATTSVYNNIEKGIRKLNKNKR